MSNDETNSGSVAMGGAMSSLGSDIFGRAAPQSTGTGMGGGTCADAGVIFEPDDWLDERGRDAMLPRAEASYTETRATISEADHAVAMADVYGAAYMNDLGDSGVGGLAPRMDGMSPIERTERDAAIMPAGALHLERRATIPVSDDDDALTSVQRKTSALVQRKASSPTAENGLDVQATAAQGVQGSGATLPHFDKIQASFGAHDVSSVRAHVGGVAADAAGAIGAEAYATGNDVAFASAPTLHTAAHEAAHVVQQRAGVQLLGGVGEAGDSYEQNADAVAEMVVQGKSAEHALGAVGVATAASAVQRKDTKTGAPKRDYTVGGALPGYKAQSIRFMDKISASLGPKQGGLPTGISGLDVTKQAKDAPPLPPSILMERPDPKRSRPGVTVQGNEVAEFQQWLAQHNALAQVISSSLFGKLSGLSKAGVLSEDFRPNDLAQIRAILHSSSRSGQVSSYGKGDESHAYPVSSAAAKVASSSANATNFGVTAEVYKSKAMALQHSLNAALSAVKAHEAQQGIGRIKSRSKTAARPFAQFMGAAEKLGGVLSDGISAAEKLASGNVFGGVMSGKKAITNAVKMVRGGDGATGALAREIGKLKGAISAAKNAQLASSMNGVTKELKGYGEAVNMLANAAKKNTASVTSSVNAFGVAAAGSIGHMSSTVGAGTASPMANVTGGQIQGVFDHFSDWEEVGALVSGLQWPELYGRVPLGGFLWQNGMPGGMTVATNMMTGAARLRWWKERIGGIEALHGEILSTIRIAGGGDA